MNTSLLKKQLLVLFFLAGFTLISCKKDPKANNNSRGFNQPNGTFIINEGAFRQSTSSITYVDPLKNTTQHLFSSVNQRPLGDVAQSFARVAQWGIIAVNGSGKVEIVNTSTFKSVATLSIASPRYTAGVSNNKAYVTNWGQSGVVSVVNLDNMTVERNIPVGNGPEEIIQADELVYVANSGGFLSDSTISVINPNSDQEIKRIIVDKNPSALVAGLDNTLWVLCKGQINFGPAPDFTSTRTSPATLVQINTNSNEVIKRIELIPTSDNIGSVSRLAISNDLNTIYYLKGGNVFALSNSDTQAPNKALIEGRFYGLDVHPSNNNIWTTNSGFVQNQEANVYNSAGTLQLTIQAGIGPNGVFFNP